MNVKLTQSNACTNFQFPNSPQPHHHQRRNVALMLTAYAQEAASIHSIDNQWKVSRKWPIAVSSMCTAVKGAVRSLRRVLIGWVPKHVWVASLLPSSSTIFTGPPPCFFALPARFHTLFGQHPDHSLWRPGQKSQS
jgi:hypothetical protein